MGSIQKPEMENGCWTLNQTSIEISLFGIPGILFISAYTMYDMTFDFIWSELDRL